MSADGGGEEDDLGPSLRLVLISDTHSQHNDLPKPFPKGDVLIHCGDFTKSRNVLKPTEYEDFARWFGALDFDTKILISGNRDDYMDTEVSSKLRKEPRPLEEIRAVQDFILGSKDIKFLSDTSHEIVHKSGGCVRVFGSPWTTAYSKTGRRKAFQLETGLLREKWKQIPAGPDILITHGPPLGILDRNKDNRESGCPALREEIFKNIRPRLHVFGHIHEAYGVHREEDILFINAACLGDLELIQHEPVVIDFPLDRSKEIRIVSGGIKQHIPRKRKSSSSSSGMVRDPAGQRQPANPQP